MKYFIVICCVLASVAAKEKKISLEDIESDNLKSGTPTRAVQSPKPQVNSPSTYGFVPTRTAADYARQQPKYVQYVPSQQYSPPPQQYQQYYAQQQPLNQANLYQQYANVPYITDNSISQQQYYTPEYVYLQQYTAPSTAIQTVVDPKGGIQYVMYIPSYIPKAEQTQNYETVVYANEQQYVVPQTQYVAQQQVTPSIKYVADSPKAQEIAQPQQVFPKQEPKSLLDSYVPSILQIQYYKQQQAQANAIQQSLKDVSGPVTGKVDYVKSYKPQPSHRSAESIINYSYQFPNQQQYN